MLAWIRLEYGIPFALREGSKGKCKVELQRSKIVSTEHVLHCARRLYEQ